MFANPEWFQVRATRTRVRPTNWRGWAYATFWVVGTLVPLMGLMSRGLAIEAMIWLFAACSLWVWEMRSVRRTLNAPPVEPSAVPEDVLVIDESNAGTPVSTRRFRFRARG